MTLIFVNAVTYIYPVEFVLSCDLAFAHSGGAINPPSTIYLDVKTHLSQFISYINGKTINKFFSHFNIFIHQKIAGVDMEKILMSAYFGFII